VYFVSGGQVTLPRTDVVDQILTEINVSLLFCDKGRLDNDYCHAMLLVEEKKMCGTYDDIVFLKQASPKQFHCYSIK
jgi:hypothetical protein